MTTEHYAWNDDYESVLFNDLEDRVIVGIKNNGDKNEMRIRTKDGFEYVMCHEQDCCESVYIEDITGDLKDLIGMPLLRAEETTNRDTNPEGVKVSEWQQSFTWTFYKLDTIKGGVTIRWYGESNGYYGEDVSLYRTRYIPEDVPEPKEPPKQLGDLTIGEWNNGN